MRARLLESIRSRSLLLIVVAVLVAFGLTTIPDASRAIADPAPTEPLRQAKVVVAGHSHSCALMVGGTVKCWGSNDKGQVGDGTRITPRSTPVDVVGISGATALTAGGNQTCAVVTGGSVKCWGDNTYGVNDPSDGVGIPTPVSVVGVSGATAVSAGWQHVCAVVVRGSVKCWGNNNSAQLGDGALHTGGPIPVDVVGISGATAVSGGNYHTCALVAGGAVKCWGRNNEGQLGDGNPGGIGILHPTPVDVAGISGATALAAGGVKTCAVVVGGTVKCWGLYVEGRLSDGIDDIRPKPVIVGISTATAVSVSEYNGCAVVAGGAVKCWGDNGSGQLGAGTDVPHQPAPVSVVGIAGVEAVSTGSQHSCVVVAGGEIKCWGSNQYRQLGDGTDINRSTPTTVLFGSCKPINYLGVRGSSEAPQGVTPSSSTYPVGTTNNGMGEPIAAQYSALRSILQRLGKANDLRGVGIVYPAIPVPDYAANDLAYLESLWAGAESLRNELATINENCNGKSTKIVLAGYSQGADVINTAAAAVQRERNTTDFKNVVSIVYYGNPSRIGGQLHELSDTKGLGIRRIAGAAVDPETDSWINNGNNKSRFTSICASLDLVCDASDNLLLGTTLVVVGGGGVLSPLGAANAAEIGYNQHTTYQTTSMNCTVRGIGVLRLTTTTCGATEIVRKLGYVVPRGTFDAFGGWEWLELKPGSQATGVLTGVAGMAYNLTIESDPVEIGTVVADSNGLAAFEFTVPASLVDGDHHLIATNSDGQRFIVPIRISATAPDESGDVIVISEIDLTSPTPTDPEPPITTGPPSPGSSGSSGSSVFGS
ncbi:MULTISPECIES: cutinase family protein [Rhodococcus]